MAEVKKFATRHISGWNREFPFWVGQKKTFNKLNNSINAKLEEITWILVSSLTLMRFIQTIQCLFPIINQFLTRCEGFMNAVVIEPRIQDQFVKSSSPFSFVITVNWH